MKTVKILVAFLALFCAFSNLAFGQAATCQISGTIYKPDGVTPAAGIAIQLVKTRKPGQLEAVTPQTYRTDSNGVIRDPDGHAYFTAPQGATIWLYATVDGLNTNGPSGVPITVPLSSTANLKDLVTVASVPSAGLTVKDEGSSMPSLIGTINFAGPGVQAMQTAPGATTVTISGVPLTVQQVNGSPVVTNISVLEFLQSSGLVVTDQTGGTVRVDLAAIPYSKLNLTGAILNADLAGGIAYSKLNLTGAIMNTDLAGSIAFSKLAALTANRALLSDGSGVVGVSSVTATELGRLAGVTNSVQTQLDGKAALSHTHAESEITNLVSDLAGKAALSHTHSEAEVTNLTSDLAAKALKTTAINPGTGLTGGGDLSADRTLSLANTAVTPGSYTRADITVDAQGRITAAANGADDAVTSVFGRRGSVVAQTNDYTWAQIDKTVSSLADLTTRSASDLNGGQVALARGGTATDLSTTGPGFLKQATLGAAVTVAALQATDLPQHTHAESDVTGLVSDLAGKVPTSRQILTAGPLSGGGNLTANRTISCAACEVTTAKGAASGYAPLDSSSKVPLENLPIVGTVTSVGTGNGLSGGPITGAGTIDLKLNASGGLSKTLGSGSDELGITANGVTNAMLAGSISDTKLSTISTAGKVADTALSTNVTLGGNGFSGTGSLLRATSPTATNATINQATNGDTLLAGKRATDTAPTGALIDLTNAAGDTSLWKVGITGQLLAGDIPTSRVSGNFVASVATSAPLSGGSSGSNAAALTISCPTCITTASSLADLATRAISDTTGSLALNRITALTASRLLVSDGSGYLAVSTTTAAEADFVHGVTSAIQTQLDAKAAAATSLTAGAGLTGGGDLSANRTFAVGAGAGITVNADDVALNLAYAPTWTATHTFSKNMVVGGSGGLTVTPLVVHAPALNSGVDMFRVEDVNSTTHLRVNQAGNILMNGNLFFENLAGSIWLGDASGGIYFGDGVGPVISGTGVDGELMFVNHDGSAPARLIIGLNTSSYTSLKRNGTGVDVRNGDDTAFSILRADALKIRDTSAAYDVKMLATSSTALTADRNLTLDLVNAARTIKLAGNLDFGGNFTTTGGAVTLTVSGTTNVTLPAAGTLSTLGGTETLTAKTLTSPQINGGTHTAITSFGIRSSGSGAFDMTVANTENLSAGRTLTVKLNDAARTLDISGNLTLANSFITSGNFATTLTVTGITNVTLPTSGTLIAADGTKTLTNTTLDGDAGTGNHLTISNFATFIAAGCNNATAAPGFDLPTSNAPTANCLTGSNAQQGTLDFSDSANQSAQFAFPLPGDWTGNIDADLYWLVTTGGGSNAVKWTIATACSASAATYDTAFNTAQTITTNVGSNNNVTVSTQTAITTTGCSANNWMHLKIGRDTTDTSTATIRLLGVRLKIRRLLQ